MIRLGNFLFRYRNAIFPLLFVPLVFLTKPIPDSVNIEKFRYVAGISAALGGQIIRALTIGLVYIIRGGRNRKVYAETLVKNGIFAHCRNPLYLGNILIVIGLGILANSPLFYLVGIPLFIFAYMSIIRAEEDFLTKKFGDEYTDYCRNINRFMPNLFGIMKTMQNMRFNWPRLLVKEYGTTYVWTMCAVLLILRSEYLKYGYEGGKNSIFTLLPLLIFITILYAIARYLKKTGKVRADD